MEMLGRMSMGIAHDFNNLLTAVLGHAELLRSDLLKLGAERDVHDHLRSLEQAAGDGAALVRKIQQYIRNEKEERAEPVALHAIAEEVLTLTRPYWYNEPRRRGIAIQVESTLRPVPAILGTPTELREVLVNLVLNAVQAMPAGGTLTLATSRRDRACVVEVGDTGVGMTASVRRRAFEPLFTTKGSLARPGGAPSHAPPLRRRQPRACASSSSTTSRWCARSRPSCSASAATTSARWRAGARPSTHSLKTPPSTPSSPTCRCRR